MPWVCLLAWGISYNLINLSLPFAIFDYDSLLFGKHFLSLQGIISLQKNRKEINAMSKIKTMINDFLDFFAPYYKYYENIYRR